MSISTVGDMYSLGAFSPCFLARVTPPMKCWRDDIDAYRFDLLITAWESLGTYACLHGDDSATAFGAVESKIALRRSIDNLPYYAPRSRNEASLTVSSFRGVNFYRLFFWSDIAHCR